METNFNQEMPYSGREKPAEAYIRLKKQQEAKSRQEFDKDLKNINGEIDQVRLEFGEIAEKQEVTVVMESDGLPRPVPISEHRSKANSYLLAECILLLASLALLAVQMFTTLDLDWRINIAVIGLVLLLMAIVLPRFLADFFKVTPKELESKEPIEKIFFISLGVGIIAFIAFSITRANPDLDGIWAWIYMTSLPITELMAAIAAACCGVLRTYFSWSIRLSRRFRKFDEKAEKTRNNISKLNRNGSTDDSEPIFEAPEQS